MRHKRKTLRKFEGAGDPPGSAKFIEFGSGVVFASPVAGSPYPNPTPLKFKTEKVSMVLSPQETEIVNFWNDNSVKATTIRINPDIMLQFANHRTGGGSSRQRRRWKRAWTPKGKK